MNLPNFVIAGVNKAGTTTLFDALAAHPQVAHSSVKETCFWLPLRYGEPQPGIETYEEFFADAPQRPITMEATPGYFYGGSTIAPELDRALPDVKILIALREPVDRLVSFFRFQKSMLHLDADLTMDRYVDDCLGHSPERLVADRALNPWFGVEGGRYDRYLSTWIDIFGDRLKIVYFEQLAAGQSELIHEVGAWLGLDPSGWSNEPTASSNRTVSPRNRRIHGLALATNRRLEHQLRRSPRLKAIVRSAYQRVNTEPPHESISDELRDTLHDLYAEHNRGLAQLLGEFAMQPPAWSTEP